MTDQKTHARIEEFCATYDIDKKLAPNIEKYVTEGFYGKELCSILDNPKGEKERALQNAVIGERMAFEKRSREHNDSPNLDAFYADHNKAAALFADDMEMMMEKRRA